MYILKTDICNDQNNEIVPQVSHLGFGYDYESQDSATKIVSNEPLDFLPNLKSIYLDPDTKATDIIRQSYIFTAGLLVSEAFYDSIRNFNLQPHEAYSAKVFYHGKFLNYYWMHITKIIEEDFDYGKSEFIESDNDGNSSVKKFSSLEEFAQRRKEFVNHLSGEITAKKIVLKNDCPLYDLFFIGFTSRTIFISPEVKDCLSKKKLTGFEIVPCEIVFSTCSSPA